MPARTLCWRARGYRTSFDAMELRQIIPTDMTASAIAHVSLLTLLVLFSEVHPFGAVTAEQIAVEIVTPQELAEKQAPPDEPPPKTSLPKTSRNRCQRHSPISPCSTSLLLPRHPRLPHRLRLPRAPQKQAALATSPAAQPQPPSQQAAPPPSQPAAPAYKPPEPDVSIKYQVLLGLPPDLSPAPAGSRARPQQGRRQFRCAGDRVPPISRARWSRHSGGISRPARNCRPRCRAPTTSRSSCAC